MSGAGDGVDGERETTSDGTCATGNTRHVTYAGDLEAAVEAYSSALPEAEFWEPP